MDFMGIEKKRITVRKFLQKPIEGDKIQKILEAGRWSPTAVTENCCMRPAFTTRCRNRIAERLIRRKGGKDIS